MSSSLKIDWLEAEVSPLSDCGDLVYSLDKARQVNEVRALGPRGWLILRREKLNVRFAVVEFSYSDADGGSVMVSGIFHGEGPSGNLRECRHTWWGGEGYVFYPNGRIITAAFKELAEFFDDMA